MKEQKCTAASPGYYRSVSSWNKGKRKEFKERKPFEVEKCPKK